MRIKTLVLASCLTFSMNSVATTNHGTSEQEVSNTPLETEKEKKEISWNALDYAFAAVGGAVGLATGGYLGFWGGIASSVAVEEFAPRNEDRDIALTGAGTLMSAYFGAKYGAKTGVWFSKTIHSGLLKWCGKNKGKCVAGALTFLAVGSYYSFADTPDLDIDDLRPDWLLNLNEDESASHVHNFPITGGFCVECGKKQILSLEY